MTTNDRYRQKLLPACLAALALVSASGCAHQKSAAERQLDEQAHAAVNAAIARGDLECRMERYTGSVVHERVCYFRGEREYRLAVTLYYLGRGPPPRPPLAVLLQQTTPELR
jgi:hypothetical protein